ALRARMLAAAEAMEFEKAAVIRDEVEELQKFLKQFPDIYPEGLVTGFFGPRTEEAVKRLQERAGIEAEGIVGPKTRAKLNELVTGGAGESGVIPPGLLTAPGLQREGATGTPAVPQLLAPPAPPPAAAPPVAPPAAATTTPPLACGKTISVPSAKYPTIQSALDAACSGDVIRIAAGSYFGAFTLTARHASTTISGAGLDETTIQGMNAPVFTLDGANGVAIKNLTVVRAGHPSTDGGGIRIMRSKNVSLEHCRVSKSVGNEGGALAIDDASSATITRCLFDSNISTHSAGGIIVKNFSRATLTNVTAVLNEARGCHGGGLAVDGTSAASVKNAIFWANSDTIPAG
ncbi:MAG: peptidoglycan-binding protein, partial [Pseudomonadota bacterium]